MRTLHHCALVLEFVESKGVEVRFHGRAKNEASHYCGQCEVRKMKKNTVSSKFLMIWSLWYIFKKV